MSTTSFIMLLTFINTLDTHFLDRRIHSPKWEADTRLTRSDDGDCTENAHGIVSYGWLLTYPELIISSRQKRTDTENVECDFHLRILSLLYLRSKIFFRLNPLRHSRYDGHTDFI